ncbi:hypothetical protein PVAP13_1NG518100 [Panicum virgatum]|uniref:Uncharacterized protein n=1 Tax=Panicum virgatum TaxID=38727 RepID=A0A8T0XAZ6_PANVG|nr:hypothetical protein PVAP13_1NG518100 [Panicum virgatum]
MDIYDHVKEKLADEQAKSIVWSSLNTSSVRWNLIMEGNLLLRAWSEDPYNQNRNPEEKRYSFGNALHLFVYLRHVHSHLLVYQKLLGKDFTKNDARALVDCKFSRVMSSLHWQLWVAKVLVDIESEAYFCKPGRACCPSPGFCLRREPRLTLQESLKRQR